jgi:hypothetical protein
MVSGCPTTDGHERLLWLCSSVFLTSSLYQAGVDLFCAKVLESRIDERPSRKHETVSDQNRVDGKVRGYIPKLWIALAAAAVMRQCTVQDLVCKCPLEFCWLEFIHKGGVIHNLRAVCRHGRQISGDQLQP